MNKIIIVFLFGVIGGMVGYVFTKRHLEYLTFFRELVTLCDKLSLEIRFNQNKLINILKNFVLECKNKDIIDNIDKFTKCLSSNTINCYSTKSSYVKQKELLDVDKFFLSLGRKDNYTEIDNLALFKELFAKKIVTIEDDKKYKNGSMIKLLFLLGLGIGIVIC